VTEASSRVGEQNEWGGL